MCLPSEGTAEVNVKAVFSGRLWQYMQMLEKGWGLIHLCAGTVLVRDETLINLWRMIHPAALSNERHRSEQWQQRPLVEMQGVPWRALRPFCILHFQALLGGIVVIISYLLCTADLVFIWESDLEDCQSSTANARMPTSPRMVPVLITQLACLA